MDSPRAHRQRNGNAAFTVVCILSILGFAALAIDIGYARKVRAELQNAVDAGANGGVAFLDGTAGGVALASTRAATYANVNPVDGASPDIGSADVAPGLYDFDAQTFTESGDPDKVNALRVKKELTGLQTVFARAAFGVASLGAGATSIAALPPPEPATAVSCYLPVAVPACLVGDAIAEGESLEIAFSSAQHDSAAWGSLEPNPSSSFFRGQIDPTDSHPCTGGTIGGFVSLQNGQVSAALSEVDDVINDDNDGDGAAASWDSAMWG